MRLLDAGAVGPKPRAVLFDLDDTLYGYAAPHARAMRAAAEKMQRLLGVPEPAFEDAFRRAREGVKEALGETASAHSRLLYFQRTIELLGLSSQPAMALDLEQTYWRSFLMAAQLFPDVAETLAELRGAGLLIGLVTDLTAQIQFRKLVYFGIDRFFDAVVTSEETGGDKVCLRPFHLVMDKLGLARGDRVWIFGDAKADVVSGCEALNAAAFQVTAGQGDKATIWPGAHGVVRDFAALRRWLPQGLASPPAASLSSASLATARPKEEAVRHA